MVKCCNGCEMIFRLLNLPADSVRRAGDWMTRFSWMTVSGLLLALAAGVCARAASKGPVDFDRDIHPILSDKCFACHGPDEKERKAKLRLDRKDEAFKPLKSGGYAVVPGHPEKSELVARLSTKDEDDLMPPPKSGKKLTPAQIDLLRRWVAEGASWQRHWAFVKPERPPLPAVKNKKWPRQEMDYFVLARLEKEGFQPSPEAPWCRCSSPGNSLARALPDANVRDTHSWR